MTARCPAMRYDHGQERCTLFVHDGDVHAFASDETCDGCEGPLGDDAEEQGEAGSAVLCGACIVRAKAEQTPEYRDEMECAHCGHGITLALRTVNGREDYWLNEDDSFTCPECGGVNGVIVDDDCGAYFAHCEDEACAACEKAAESEQKERHLGA